MWIDLISESSQEVCQKGDGLDLRQLEVHEDMPADIIHLFRLHSCAHSQTVLAFLSSSACETHQQWYRLRATLHKGRLCRLSQDAILLNIQAVLLEAGFFPGCESCKLSLVSFACSSMQGYRPNLFGSSDMQISCSGMQAQQKSHRCAMAKSTLHAAISDVQTDSSLSDTLSCHSFDILACLLWCRKSLLLLQMQQTMHKCKIGSMQLSHAIITCRCQ